MKQFSLAVLLSVLLICLASAQQPMRFTLPTDFLDLTQCVAQPGNVIIPLGASNTTMEIVNWTTRPASIPQAGEFVLRFKQPTQAGSLIQYEGGDVSVEVSNEWKAVAYPLDAGRKLRIVPLPSGQAFSAIRITVPPVKTNGLYQSRLGFATLLPVRAINVAAIAEVTANSTAGGAEPQTLVDGVIDLRQNFSTVTRDQPLGAGAPESITLTWATPQRFRGLGFFRGALDEGLGARVFQTFSGAGDPKQSTGANGWRTIPAR